MIRAAIGCFGLILFPFVGALAFANTFTEDFSNTTHQDTANTTAEWNTSAHCVRLGSTYSFSQPNLANWGGQVDSVHFDGYQNWLVGGQGGRLNSYNGVSWTELSAKLPAACVNTMWISCISGGALNGLWVIGGGGRLILWDGGANFSDQTAALNWVSAGIHAVACGISSSSFLVAGDRGKLSVCNGGYHSPLFSDLSGSRGYFANTTTAYSMGTNGSYWLIGGDSGNLAKYSGGTFTDLGFQLRATGWSTNTVNTIGWDGARWLIGGSGGHLVSYNGSSFTDLTGNIYGTMVNVFSLQYNGSYWLIGGNGQNGEAIVFCYDGSSWTNESALLPGNGSNPIYALDYGNNEWLMGGVCSSDPYQAFLYSRNSGAGYTDKSNLLKKSSIIDVNVVAADPNGAVLVGGKNSCLNTYNGSSFSNLKGPNGSYSFAAIAGNGAQWLLGDDGRLTTYNGTFNDLSSQLNFSPAGVKAIHWNGTDWLIGGANRQLKRYNGGSFTSVDLSTVPGMFGATDSVQAIQYGGGSWVIGGSSGSLAGYNGNGAWDLDPGTHGFTNINAVGFGRYNGTNYMMVGGSSVATPQQVRIWNADTKAWGSWVVLSGFTGAVKSIDYNSAYNYWLIGGDNGKLNQYDWKNVTDLSSQLTGFMPSSAIKSLAWNGEYWLLGGEMGQMYKYGPIYATSGAAQSLTVAMSSLWFVSATLTVSQTLNNQSIMYFLTANNGTNWEGPVSPGTPFTFANKGQALRWRSVLSTNNAATSPWLTSVSINYSEATQTSTISPTPTITPTMTPTITAVSTSTPTPTISPTLTVSATLTATLVSTSTSTPSIFELDKRLRVFHSQINPTVGERARIRWYQSERAAVDLVIYNLLGDKVATLVSGQMLDGSQFQEIAWNGRTQSGALAGSGIYIVYLHRGEYKDQAKIAVIK